jgi:hypothetical protein
VNFKPTVKVNADAVLVVILEPQPGLGNAQEETVRSVYRRRRPQSRTVDKNSYEGKRFGRKQKRASRAASQQNGIMRARQNYSETCLERYIL